MTWIRGTLLLYASIFLAAIPALSQGVAFSGVINIEPKVLHNPYSLVQETEETRTLSDGTHVVTKTETRLYRDSDGRTRHEMKTISPARGAEFEHSNILIDDPVSGHMYMLDPEQHVAQVIAIPSFPPFPAPSVSPNVSPKPTPPSADAPPKRTSEDLGTQTIQGVFVKGTRTTITIPAGSFGNDRPVQVVQEDWFSDDLKVELESKNSDPRFGDSVTRVISLDRSEPDPALFQVPADYVVRDEGNKLP